MNIQKPKISILTPSYNHEKFVTDFIKSVLNQTEQDFELIIVDDHSIDNNVKEIKKFNDERIILIQHEYNKGINAGLNTAFALAKGEYIVFISSDDILEPNHLEYTSRYLDENPNIGTIYCALKLINENNEIIEDEKNIYVRQNRSKYEILRDSFLFANVLLSPGVTTRKKIFSEIHPLDLSLIQYQDYDMHVNFLLNDEIFITEEKLINYRQFSKNQNISAKTFTVSKREELETFNLMNNYLKINDIEIIKKIFKKDELEKIGEPINEVIPYFLGRLALNSPNVKRKEWGYKIIMNFISVKSNFELLNKLYGFDYKQYIDFVNNFADPGIKFNKYKKLFNLLLVICIILSIIIFILLGFCLI